MPEPDAGGATAGRRPRTLSEAYRRFGAGIAEESPLYGRVAVALGASPEALRAIGAAPPRKRQPALVLAALHDLALAGRAPRLAAAYASGDPDAAAAAAVETLVRLADQVVATAVRRQVPRDQTGRSTVLHPAVAEAAHRAGATAVGLVDVGRAAALNVNVDRVCVEYGNGQVLGDPTSALRLSCSVVGQRPLPVRAVPEVVARVGVDLHPLDVTDAEDARWLLACVPPDQRERAALLSAEIASSAASPPLLLSGDLVEVLPDALARVPTDALPVVTSTWALSQLRPEHRSRFLHRLAEAASGRPVAWVSVEGVGVAPGVPTLGDRRASGHSIIGLTMLGPSGTCAEALGRCWSRGRLLAWEPTAQR